MIGFSIGGPIHVLPPPPTPNQRSRHGLTAPAIFLSCIILFENSWKTAELMQLLQDLFVVMHEAVEMAQVAISPDP